MNFIIKTKNLLKNKKILVIVLMAVFALGIIVPSQAHAILDQLGDAFYILIGMLFRVQLVFSSILLALSGMVLDLVIDSALNVQSLDSVDRGWSIARDTVNMFFVIFLLIIAFATILRIEAYQYKALLPKLIFSILLVNFSRTICNILIEFANVLTATFLNFSTEGSAGANSAAAIAAMMGVGDILSIDTGIEATRITNPTMLAAFAIIILLVTIMAVAFAGLAGMLLMRTVALLVLIVLSPFAFVMNVLPATKSYFSEWWENFMKFCFYGPIAAFCLFLTANVVADARGDTGNLALGESLTGIDNNTTLSIGVGGFIEPSFLWKYGLAIGLLFFGISMIRKGGDMMSKMSIDLAKKGIVGGYAMAGKAIGKRVSRGLAGAGKGERAMGWKASSNRMLRGLGKATDYLRFASPKVTKEAWDRRQAELDRKAYGESIGWAHSKMNALTFSKDKTDYERRAQSAGVDTEIAELKKDNPNHAHPYLRDQLYKSVEDGDMDRAEACMRLLDKEGNFNEIVRDLATGVEGAEIEKFHSQGFINANKDEDGNFVARTDTEALKDMLIHVFGKERGVQILLDQGEKGKENGNWASAEAVEYKDGKFVLKSPEGQAEDSAGEFSKRDADKQLVQSRFTFTKETTNSKGEESVAGLSENYKKFLENHSWSAGATDRVDRKMNDITRGKMCDDAAIKDAVEIIKKQSGSMKERNVNFYKELVAGQKISDAGKRMLGEIGITEAHVLATTKEAKKAAG